MCGIVLLFLRNDRNFFCFYFGQSVGVVVLISGNLRLSLLLEFARGIGRARLPFRIVFGNFGAAFSLIIHLLIVDFFHGFWYSYRRNVRGKRRAKPDDAKLRRKSEIFCPYAAVKT